jgi:tRNA nucleotidyltransferase (CCA-adding enzyme)
LFLALLRRYDLGPYRYRGQRRTTVMVKVPKRFVDETLWPHFERANAELRQHLEDVAFRVIEGALAANSKEPEEREQPQRALAFDAPEL